MSTRTPRPGTPAASARASADLGTPVPADLGRLLRAAREAAGLDLAQVGARTLIRLPVLQALERGDTARSGGPVYARHHVRAVAAALHVDPGPLLAAVGPPPAAVVVDRVAPVSSPVGTLLLPAARPLERLAPRWGRAAAATMGVLAGVLLLGSLVGRGGGAPGTVAAPGASAPAAPGVRPVVPPRPTPSPAVGARMRLLVSGGPSWVRVVSSSGVGLFEGVLPDGSRSREFRDARRLALTVGNASAVRVVCDGRDLGPAGGPGQVRRLSCGPASAPAATPGPA